MLICISKSGYIYEIDPDGNSIWSKSTGGSVSNAFRYSAAYVAGSGISVTANAAKSKICMGSSVQLNVSASGGSDYIYLWSSMPVGFTSALQNPTVTPLENTTYTVTVTSGTDIANSSIAITVNPLPSATLNADGSTNICDGSSIKLSAATGTGFSYKWIKDDYTISGSVTNSYQAKTAGSFRVVITNSFGCSDTSDAIKITVFPKPNASISTTGKTTFCEGETVELKATIGENLKYKWLKDNSDIPDAVSPVYSCKEGGSYRAIVYFISECADTSDPLVTTMFPKPQKPEIVRNYDTLIARSSVAVKYLWYFDDELIEGESSSILIPTKTGNYKVQIINDRNCLSDFSRTILYDPLGVDEENSENLFNIFPNPTTGELKISGKSLSEGGFKLSLLDIFGRNLADYENQTSIDLTSLNSGVYYFKLKTSKGILIRKNFVIIK
jgi:hypothetical protein